MAPMPLMRSISRSSVSQPSTSPTIPAVSIGRLQNDGSRAIAKENCRTPIVPVHELRQRIGTDNDCIAHCAAANQRRPGRKSIHEARACRIYVHRAGTVRAEQLLNARCGIRHLVVAGTGPENDEIELLGLKTRAGESPGSRDVSEVRNPHMADRTLPNPRALDDPRVARVEQRSKIVIGEASRRQAFAPAGNDGVARICDSHSARIPRSRLLQRMRS